MPNWCLNDLTISHPDPMKVQELCVAYRDGRLLDYAVPMPKELLQGDGWYDWAVENWGTKWDISPDTDIHRASPTEAAFSFSSAWGPPTEAMQALADAGFSLDLFYIEEGVGFAGRFHADADGSYDESGDVPDDLPEAVADHFAHILETYESEED